MSANTPVFNGAFRLKIFPLKASLLHNEGANEQLIDIFTFYQPKGGGLKNYVHLQL